MYTSEFKGYIEGKDKTKVSPENLVYPSKNVIVNKGTISTRGGLVNDGVAASGTGATHSEFVWKDALGGERPMRVSGQTLQVKYSGRWYTIFTALDSGTIRVYFTTWVDINTTVVKKRLVFSDGSTNLYTWNGAIGVVASADTNTATLTSTIGTCLQQGFDAGNVTAQTILHFIGTAVTANSEESQNNNPTGQDLEISGTFDTTPVAGDIIIAKPVTLANEISSAFDIDVVYTYKNHLVCANFNRVSLYFSHISTYSLATGFDFTMPVAADRTAATAILMQLDGHFTSMISRKNVLWVSDKNDWYKVSKTEAKNAYDLWVDVEKFETGENKGALPMAVAKYKEDIIYMAQDKTLQRVTTVEILGTDEIRLLSDDVEDLFGRLDMDDVRIYYFERAIYIVCPQDSTVVILDLIEEFFQPPQTLPVNCLSVIDGVLYGHSNGTLETFEMFDGRNDLDSPIEAVMAFGYTHGEGETKHPFRYKQHTIFGLSCRLTVPTKVSIDHYWEETGAKATSNTEFEGGDIKTYAVSEDLSFATHPYGSRSWAGADMDTEELRRAMVFDKFTAFPYFEYQPVITITGDDPEFVLLGWWIDQVPASRKIGNDLFISK